MLVIFFPKSSVIFNGPCENEQTSSEYIYLHIENKCHYKKDIKKLLIY